MVNTVVEDPVSSVSVAKQFGYSHSTVYSLVKKIGLKLPENGYVKSAVAREVMEEIIREASETTPRDHSDKIDELIQTHGLSYQDILVIAYNSRKRSHDQASRYLYTLEVQWCLDLVDCRDLVDYFCSLAGSRYCQIMS